MIYISRLTSNFTNIITAAVSRYCANEIQNVAYNTCNINIKGIYGKYSNTLYTGIPPDFTIPCFATQNFAISPRKCNALFAWWRSFFLSPSRKLIYYGCCRFVQRRGDGINHHKNMVDGNELWKDNSNVVSRKSSSYIMYFLLPYF